MYELVDNQTNNKVTIKDTNDLMRLLAKNNVDKETAIKTCSWFKENPKCNLTLKGYNLSIIHKAPLKLNDMKSIVNMIKRETGIQINYDGKDNRYYVFSIELGTSVLCYDEIEEKWMLKLISTNGEALESRFYSKNNIDFMSTTIDALNRLKTIKPAEVHYIINYVADAITAETNIKHSEMINDNGSFNIDFDYGISYLRNNGGKSFYFALNDENGKELWTCSERFPKDFIIKVVKELKRRNLTRNADESRSSKVSIRNKDVVDRIESAKRSSSAVQFRVFSNGIWFIDIETSVYGNYRIWVGYEYKDGTFNQSLCYVNNGKCVADFKLTEAVVNKMLSLDKALKARFGEQ